ncbi:MAG TPA: hypothetical protein PKD50_25635 [Leptospiraceae bacterium]|nr:hypothetical protein [Leptospiraceae bacterium]
MKKILIILTILISTMLVSDCKKEEGTSIGGGMASVDDSTSQKNVVSIAKQSVAK